MRYAISSGSPFEKIGGYSRAVVDGDWVFISGTAGYVAGETDADDAEAQTRKALEIIGNTLQECLVVSTRTPMGVLTNVLNM